MKKGTKKISSEPVRSEEQERFARLCAEDEAAMPPEAFGIGTYNEKRIHRIVKRFVCDDERCFEIKVGRYVADVLEGGRITEIQTASFSSLTDKIRFYLEHTDYHITVLHPMIADKKIIRTDKESGELIRTKRSPKHLKPADALPELLYIAEFIGDPRFEIRFLMIRADEYRYSEKMRYRKKGAYDNDVVPRELMYAETVRSVDDVRSFFPLELRDTVYRASDIGKALGLGGRKLYRALGCLTALGIIEKIPDGKRTYVYKYAN